MNVRLHRGLVIVLVFFQAYLYGRGIVQVRPIVIDHAWDSLTNEPLSIIVPPKRYIPLLTPYMLEGGKFPFRYALTGYVKHEAFYDSQQVVASVQGHLLRFPFEPSLDRCGRNINRKGQFNMLTIETRVRFELAGPRLFNAKSYAAVEVDMWSECTLQIGLVRERNAFMYFDWDDRNLLIGLYWHPLFVTECYPQTVSFNTGSPMEPYTREPQVRYTKRFDNVSFMFAALARGASPVDGPLTAGITDETVTQYTRWGVMPNLDFQTQITIGDHLIGLGVDVTRYVPRLATDYNYRITESFLSVVGIGYAVLSWPSFAVRMKAIYGQNGDGYTLISGYAVSSIDPYTDERTYANLQSVGGWIDMNYRYKVEPGLFLGFTKNIGATRSIITNYTNPQTGLPVRTVYSNGFQDLGYVFRISPRVKWINRPFVFGAELELTTAGWGKITTSGKVNEVKNVNNVRAIFATYYMF